MGNYKQKSKCKNSSLVPSHSSPMPRPSSYQANGNSNWGIRDVLSIQRISSLSVKMASRWTASSRGPQNLTEIMQVAVLLMRDLPTGSRTTWLSGSSIDSQWNLVRWTTSCLITMETLTSLLMSSIVSLDSLLLLKRMDHKLRTRKMTWMVTS